MGLGLPCHEIYVLIMNHRHLCHTTSTSMPAVMCARFTPSSSDLRVHQILQVAQELYQKFRRDRDPPQPTASAGKYGNTTGQTSEASCTACCDFPSDMHPELVCCFALQGYRTTSLFRNGSKCCDRATCLRVTQ